MPNIEFEKVTAYYQNSKDKTTTLVLENFCYLFKKNSITSIVGKSGCGKTTLLRCIIDTVPYEGNVYFDNENVDQIQVKDRNIAYMPQINDLLPKKTVFDNIIFPLLMRKVPELEAREKVYKISEEFGISFLLARKVKELSIGQQKLVTFAKCIIKNPDVILLDEPTAGLDKENSEYVLNFLKAYLTRNKTTVIMVTHNIDEAMLFSDEILIMNDGEAILSGKPNSVYKSKNKVVYDLIHAEGEE